MSLHIPSKDTFNKLTCESCKNYLSHFPIYIKRGTTAAICGRCIVPEPGNYDRDNCFEEIAQFLHFPCINKANGCLETLPPSQLEKHEANCMHIKKNCRINNVKCSWNGSVEDLLAHYQESHPDLLLKDSSFELNFLSSTKDCFLLVAEDLSLFYVTKEVDSRKGTFSCTVELLKSNDDSVIYNYFLKVYNNNKDYWYKYHTEKLADGLQVSRLSYKDLSKVLFEPQNFIVTVKVVWQVKMVVSGRTQITNLMQNPNIEWEVLSNLECPVCYDFMIPPIFQCLNGHSFCKGCKLSLNGLCPICRRDILDTQNFTLQKVTELLNYPCKFYLSGCNFYSKSERIRQHEETCEFGPLECPFKSTCGCAWNDVMGKLGNHINDHHLALLITNDQTLLFDTNNQEKEEAYLIKFKEQMFKLMFKYSQSKFNWYVQFLGPQISMPVETYRFNLQVLDDSGKARAYVLVGMVVPLNIREPFSDIENYLVLNHDNVRSFFDQQLRYKVNIISGESVN